MFEKFFSWLSEKQEKHAIAVVTVFLIFSVFMAYYALNLQTDSSFDTLYGKDSQHYQLKNLVSNEFGSTDQLFVLVELDHDSNDATKYQDIRHPDIIDAIQKLELSLESEPSVEQVTTIADLLMFRYGRLPSSLEESKSMLEGFSDEQLRGFVNSDNDKANLIVNINVENKPGSLNRAQEAMEARIADATRPAGVNFVLTGETTLIDRIMNLLISDNLVTVGIAVLAVFIILGFTFRSPGISLVASSPMILALIWLAGTLVLLDIRITMMTAAVGAMMVGMGIDYSIHVTHGYVSALRKGTQKILAKVVPDVGGALLASALTTMAGFLAMLFGSSPSSQTQGFVLATGIGYAFIASIVFLPSLLELHRRITYSDIDKVMFQFSEETNKKNIIIRFLERLAKFQVNRPGMVLLFFGIGVILILPGMSLVRMDTSNDNWIPPNDPVMEGLEKVSNDFGGLESQNFLVMFDAENLRSDTPQDLRHPNVMKRIADVDAALEDLDLVDRVSTPTDAIKAANSGLVPQDFEKIKSTIEENPSISEYFNDDYSIMLISAIGDNFYVDESDPGVVLRDMMAEIEAVGLPDGVVVIPQGGMASDLELNKLLEEDTQKTTLLGFLFVFLIALFMYRSFTVGFLSFIPIIISLILTVGIMGYIDLPFTVLTTGMLAIVMGMGIDFSIHIIDHAKRELDRGKSLLYSISESLTHTGEAIFVSTITTIVGFSSLILATLLATQRLGITLAIAILFAFITVIFVVPATLAVEYKIKKKLGG